MTAKSTLESVTSRIPRQSVDFSQRLPKGWETNVLHGDRACIERAVVSGKGKLAASLTNWYNPPTLSAVMRSRPNPGHYFHRRLFLWMTGKKWPVVSDCPCRKSRRSGFEGHLQQGTSCVGYDKLLLLGWGVYGLLGLQRHFHVLGLTYTRAAA